MKQNMTQATGNYFRDTRNARTAAEALEAPHVMFLFPNKWRLGRHR